MGYRFRPDEAVEDGLRRIALEQIDKALAELDGLDDRDQIAHQIRKRCKKLRGLIRLVRPAFADYADENARFRDTARLLSGPRDALVRRQTLAALRRRHAGTLADHAFAAYDQALAAQCRDTADDTRAAFGACRIRLREARSRVAGWSLAGEDFDAIADGLRRTYERARRTMARARETRDAGDMHQWRKRVTYHWHHLRLLNGLWPALMAPWERQANRLSGRLGDAHDLAVLDDTLPEVGEPPERDTLRALIAHRRLQLQQKAFGQGVRLLAESPDALGERWQAYWKAWREDAAP